MERNYPVVRLRTTLVIEFTAAESAVDGYFRNGTPQEQLEWAYVMAQHYGSEVAAKTELVEERSGQ